MATILILGADGQVGRELAARAARASVATHAARRSDVDITDSAQVRAALARTKPSLVVNAAAYTAVDRAEAEPKQAFLVNAGGAGIVAAACAAAGVALLHLSTDYVFDGTKPAAYTEDDPMAPLNVYGSSKADGETAVRRALPRHLILRTSWVYGVHGTNFLKTMLRLARERDELRVVADQRGSPTATADIAAAILAVARRLDTGTVPWGTWHFAGTGVTTWHGFAAEIVEAQGTGGRRPAVVPITSADYPQAATRPANSVLDSSRFARAFGVRAADWRTRTREVVAALAADALAGAP